jgi:peptide/nickel transport system ATP-binding protein
MSYIKFEKFGIKTSQQQYLIRDIDLEIPKGQFLALVGESGSGKSLTALSLGSLLDQNLRTEGEIIWEDKNILQFSEQEQIEFRKNTLGFVFQNPMHCLNPSMTCGKQIEEVFEVLGKDKNSLKQSVEEVLHQVDLQDTERIIRSYPHELSGGQKQRVMIAIALASNAEILIADEPTTALDVIVQAEILDLLKKIQESKKITILFITHDLHVAFKYANYISVMKNGRIVEQNTISEIKNNPQQIYTQALIACRPSKDYKRPLPTVEQFENNKKVSSKSKPKFNPDNNFIEVNDLSFAYQVDNHILKGINFSIFEGESVGIVGASGSGKSTLGKCLMRLEENISGEIKIENQSIYQIPISEFRKKVQMVFQDPFGALDSRPKVKNQLLELTSVYLKNQNKADQIAYLEDLMSKIGLDKNYLEKRPRNLSGGQRQRICIARSLITGAKILILDESIAALDVSVQATILNLLNNLRDEFGLTYLFISHDLASVQYFCDRILVLENGTIVDYKPSDELLDNPHPYTKKLWDASLGNS